VRQDSVELQKEIQKLQEENQLLKEENAYLKFQLKELQEKIYKKRHKEKEAEGDIQKKEPKKRGAPFGHLGWFRKKPKKIDQIEIVQLGKSLYPPC
jgi:predicted  nucleic acid-binding Zn-ribbon protein